MDLCGVVLPAHGQSTCTREGKRVVRTVCENYHGQITLMCDYHVKMTLDKILLCPPCRLIGVRTPILLDSAATK